MKRGFIKTIAAVLAMDMAFFSSSTMETVFAGDESKSGWLFEAADADVRNLSDELRSIDIRDVIYINGEKYICYDKYEIQNENTGKSESYGRFLKLSDEYYCIWQNGVDYTNGVTVKAFGEAPEYGEDKNMEEYISDRYKTQYQNVEKSRADGRIDMIAQSTQVFDLSADKAMLNYGTEDKKGTAVSPRFYIDTMLLGNADALNGEYSWLADAIRDTLSRADGSDGSLSNMSVFCGIGYSGAEDVNQQGNAYTVKGGATSRFCSKDNNPFVWGSDYQKAVNMDGGGANLTSNVFQTGSIVISPVAKDLYDYSWNYSSGSYVDFNSTTKSWEGHIEEETMGTYKVGEATPHGGTGTLDGKKGTVTHGSYSQKKIYKHAPSGYITSATDKWSSSCYTKPTWYNTKNTQAAVTVNYNGIGTAVISPTSSDFTGYEYVEIVEPKIQTGTAGTVDNAKNHFFLPSIDLKITDENDDDEGAMCLDETIMCAKKTDYRQHSVTGDEYVLCDTVKYYTNDKCDGQIGFDLDGISDIDTKSEAIDDNEGDVHYKEGRIDLSGINVKKYNELPGDSGIRKSYSVNYTVSVYETEKRRDVGESDFSYKKKKAGGSISGTKWTTGNISKDTVFLAEITDNLTDRKCERLIYVEPCEDAGIAISGPVTMAGNDRNSVKACEVTKLNDSYYGLAVNRIDEAGFVGDAVPAEDYELLGKKQVEQKLTQLRSLYRQRVNDADAGEEELKELDTLIRDYSCINFEGDIDDAAKTIRPANVTGSNNKRNLMVRCGEDYAILTINVVGNGAYQDRTSAMDADGFYSYLDEDTGITWHYIYDTAGRIDYLYTESDISGIISEGGALMVPSEINGVRVDGIGGAGSGGDLHTFIPLSHPGKNGVELLYDWRSVYIPSTIKKINDGAFKDIRTGQNVAADASYNPGADTSISIPSTVSYIGAEAFSGTNIVSLKISDGAGLTIGDKAFYNASALKDICFYGSMTEDAPLRIGREAFAKDVSVESLYIPRGMVFLGGDGEANTGSGANFAGLTGLGTLVIDAAVMPEDVFDGCDSLGKVVFGKDVREVFAGWSGNEQAAVSRETYVKSRDTIFYFKSDDLGSSKEYTSPFGTAGVSKVYGIESGEEASDGGLDEDGSTLFAKLSFFKNANVFSMYQDYARGKADSVEISFLAEDGLSGELHEAGLPDEASGDEMTGIEASYDGAVCIGEYLDEGKLEVHPVYGAVMDESTYKKGEYYVMYTSDFKKQKRRSYSNKRQCGGMYYLQDPSDLYADIERVTDKGVEAYQDQDGIAALDVTVFVLKKAVIDGREYVLVDESGRMEAFSSELVIPVEKKSTDSGSDEAESVRRYYEEQLEKLPAKYEAEYEAKNGAQYRAQIAALKAENEGLKAELAKEKAKNEALQRELTEERERSNEEVTTKNTTAKSGTSGGGSASGTASKTGSSEKGASGNVSSGGASGGGSAGGSSGGGGGTGSVTIVGSSDYVDGYNAGYAMGESIGQEKLLAKTKSLSKAVTRLTKVNRSLKKKVKKLKKQKLSLKKMLDL